jgi:RimJ/RimL family protein N-acetyltransferase
MWRLDPRLTGEIVVLEPLAPVHRDGLFAAARPPEIWRWWHVNAGRDENSFRSWFDDALRAGEDGSRGHFATVDARSGTLLGSTSFCTPRPENRGVEIGYTWLTPAAWGTGANTEAKLLQLRHAFEQLGCVRVEFDTDAGNERSRAALAALGAQFEGILRDRTLLADGSWGSSAYYSILAAEWPAVRDALTARVAAAVARRAS